MKNKNNIIIAGFIAVIGFTALVKGFMFMFIGCLLVSGMIIGGSKAMDLIETEDQEKDFKKSNLKNGALGIALIGAGVFVPGIIGLALSFVGGIFVGLIFVNAMFDKK
jgi:hypothetical protein